MSKIELDEPSEVDAALYRADRADVFREAFALCSMCAPEGEKPTVHEVLTVIQYLNDLDTLTAHHQLT